MPQIKSKILSRQDIVQFDRNARIGQYRSDGDNLYLFKNKYSTVWRLLTTHQVGNKQLRSWKRIGDANTMPLKIAREQANKLRELIKQNIHVHTHTKENTLLGKRFGEIVDIYIQQSKRNLKPQSKNKLIAVINKASILNNTIISKITENDIAHVIERVKKKSPSTAATLLRELKSIFSFAFDEKYMISKLDISLKARYKIQHRTRYLDECKLGKLFKQLANDEDIPLVIKVAIYALFITMLRRDELLSLMWDDVDLSHQKITIRNAKRIDNFIVRIPHQLVEQLRELRKQMPNKKYVFSCRNYRYSGDTLCRYCKELGVKYGIGEFTPHDARRTGMTLLSDRGHSYKVIDMALGHVQQGVNKSYLKTHLSEPRAQLLQDYADLIDKLIISS